MGISGSDLKNLRGLIAVSVADTKMVTPTAIGKRVGLSYSQVIRLMKKHKSFGHVIKTLLEHNGERKK